MELIKTNIKGIYYLKNKNNTISYYGKYRDPQTKKSMRKKLITKDKHLSKYVNESRKLLDEIIDIKKNDTSHIIEEIKFTNNLTLNQLAAKYYEFRINRKIGELRKYYNHLSDQDFQNDRVVKRQINSVKKEQLKYNKNTKNSEIGNINLNQITKKNISDYINNYVSKLNISETTSYMTISNIRTIVNYGIKEEIIDIKNPFQNIKNKNPMRVRERALKPIELKMLLDKCKEEKNPSVYMSVYLGVITAARLNSVLNIRKKDIIITNEDNGYIKIINYKNKNKNYKIGLNKKSTDWFSKVLNDYQYDEYLIRPINKNNQKEFKPMSSVPKKVYDIMDDLFNSHLKKQNNFDRDMVCNFHSIRRSISTNLATNNVSIYEIMNILNHSSVLQTQKYLNLKNLNINNSLNKLNNQIFDPYGEQENEPTTLSELNGLIPF